MQTPIKKLITLLGAMTILIITLVILLMQGTDNNDSAQDHSGIKHLPVGEVLEALPSDGGTEYNRLVFEKSPYLLQHATNPVDWYPWGDEAFDRATAEDKPIFLSIGYSTCHWCHVMAHESFGDSTVAALMNDAFVCIKVDREERPDIDQLYMAVCQAMTGSGGWPLTIVMTPDRRPFFAGTYYPKKSLMQRMGMLDLIPKIAEVWRSQRDKINESADQIVSFLRNNASSPAGDALPESMLKLCFEQLSGRYDSEYGGFGNSPKFPSPHNFTFLLRYWHRSGDAKALAMVENTLRKMRLGGIFDQVGFGFHRYSTDQVWLLPHFEKMLYDQATLGIAYVETYQATGKEEYAETAREIFTYVLRDMTSPEGGFYSAEDADSEGEEGLFYLWTPQQFKEVLGDEEGQFFIDLFNVEEGGNFADQATQQHTGNSILHLNKPLTEWAEHRDISASTLKDRWEKARQKLFDVREKRIHPLKDDKILTDWNGLMIAALAKAASALSEEKYARAASKAADFVITRLRRPDGRLLKRYRQGEASLPAHAEDYAFMIWGLIDLYEATFEVRYLKEAIALNKILLQDFWDNDHGGLYYSAETAANDILVRSKEIYDGAIPSANSVHALNLIRLSRLTGDESLGEKSIQIGKAFASRIDGGPMSSTQLMSAVDFQIGPAHEVVIAGKPDAADTKAMLAALRTEFLPNKVVIFRPEQKAAEEIIGLISFTEHQRALNGKATAYVCQNFACKAPTTEVTKMMAGLLSKQEDE